MHTNPLSPLSAEPPGPSERADQAPLPHRSRLLHKGQIQHVPFSCRTMKLTDAGYQTIGLWCPVCESVALELYAIPNAFTARCIPCARASLRMDEVAALVT